MQKAVILAEFHSRLETAVAAISTEQITHQEKAQKVNALVSAVKAEISPRLQSVPIAHRGEAALLLQYCYSVAGLEYRHRVWPYEYMAFSRRIGELWEAFCKTAWDYSSNELMTRISFPLFNDVRTVLLNRLHGNIGAHVAREEMLADIDTLFGIVGDINMKEDEVCSVAGKPHIVDFKSGFGSNEKGNMLRLDAVGRAYRIWNHETRLMLLVRQNVNNNYLEVLRRTGLWEVYTGSAAYDQMAAITGVDIQQIRARVIDWRSDLSPGFFNFLERQATNLTTYLEW